MYPRPPVPVLVGRAREAVDEEQEAQHQYHNSLRESFSLERRRYVSSRDAPFPTTVVPIFARLGHLGRVPVQPPVCRRWLRGRRWVHGGSCPWTRPPRPADRRGREPRGGGRARSGEGGAGRGRGLHCGGPPHCLGSSLASRGRGREGPPQQRKAASGGRDGRRAPGPASWRGRGRAATTRAPGPASWRGRG